MAGCATGGRVPIPRGTAELGGLELEVVTRQAGDGSHPEGGGSLPSAEGTYVWVDEEQAYPTVEPPAWPTGPDYGDPEWDAGEGLWRMEQWAGEGTRKLWSAALGDLWHPSVEEAEAYRDREGV